jgi:hypothetical protein
VKTTDPECLFLISRAITVTSTAAAATKIRAMPFFQSIFIAVSATTVMLQDFSLRRAV